MKKFKVWECKIIVPEGAILPPGFDNPPRTAAIAAVEAAGVEILGCSSGWGGSLSKEEEDEFIAHGAKGHSGVYVAGLMDTPEDVAH